MPGFPNQQISDSWGVGCGGADHVDTNDRSRLGDRSDGVPRRAFKARRARARRPQVSGGAAFFHNAQHHVAGVTGAIRTLEQCVETVLASEPKRHARGVLRGVGGHQPERAPHEHVRLHGRAGPRVRRGRKRGQDAQALGRSRGGFSSKIHLKTDHAGMPIAFHLTGGEAADSTNFQVLLDIGPDVTPRAAITDKGYDAKSNRNAARARGICPVIPYRDNAKAKPKFLLAHPLQGARPHRANGRPTQAVQASGDAMREDRNKLPLDRCVGLWFSMDTNPSTRSSDRTSQRPEQLCHPPAWAGRYQMSESARLNGDFLLRC